MDMVASPTVMSSTPPIDENAVRRANLAPSDAVAVDIGHNDEEQWNKPPLLKHVYARCSALCSFLTKS
jgi:hypothetical protein